MASCFSTTERDPPPFRAASGLVTSADGSFTAQAFVRFSKGVVSVTSGQPELMVKGARVELARFTAGYRRDARAGVPRRGARRALGDGCTRWARGHRLG